MSAVTALRRALNVSARLYTLPRAGQQQHAMSLSSQRHPPEVLRLDGAHPRACAVLTYWFGEGFDKQPWSYVDPDKQKMWYGGGPEVDEDIRQRFGEDIQALEGGKYNDWTSPNEQLAAIILSDQMTRNVYRGTARMYALDDMGLQISKQLLERQEFNRLNSCAQQFAGMPLMHSESIADHEQLNNVVEKRIEEAQEYGDEAATKLWQMQHKFLGAHTEVVKQWGRYPHRNAILGRPSTAEEVAGMQGGTIPKW